ncbi:MAG: hypothetical protein JNK23_15470 [Opitutaceae bacterium]|nr:hypothetical protein [Opitutaceae bacterium]
MKKTFPLTDPRLAPDRVRDKIRHELKRFSRNRHRRPLPEGYNQWRFDCKIGATADAAQSRPFTELGTALDALARSGAAEAYIEINVKPIHNLRGS